MEKSAFIVFLLTLNIACNPQRNLVFPKWIPYDETKELLDTHNHESESMHFQQIQSKVLDKNIMLNIIYEQLGPFSQEDYLQLKPLILEQDILTIQAHIRSGSLNYVSLTKWFLYRIALFENDKNSALNALMSINPKVVEQARLRDKNLSENKHPLFGMPILLKDNINAADMPTTAGAHAMLNNFAEDAEIVINMKTKGALILGKTNLSEWANFFCASCPNGFSTVGGQTLNPYGRKLFDTGGSSSGSGAAVAANYAIAAIGTETLGSILSPASQHSLVGLKPATGLLRQEGIVPLSSTYDTPGPMTKNLNDNLILLSAMTDKNNLSYSEKMLKDLQASKAEDFVFGVNKYFLNEPLYRSTVQKIQDAARSVEFEYEQMNYEGLTSVLNRDMISDLPDYLDSFAAKEIAHRTVEDIIKHNALDNDLRMPYGQKLFNDMIIDTTTKVHLNKIKKRLREDAVKLLGKIFDTLKTDVILSVNNWNAAEAALGNYPCMTIPMGYQESGEPIGLTLIVRPGEEEKLFKIAFALKKILVHRKVRASFN